MFILTAFLFIAATMVAMFFAGGIFLFINIPSLLLTLPLIIIFTVAATSWNNVLSAWCMVIRNKDGLSQQDYKESRQVFMVMGTSAMLVGLFMTLIGVIAVISNAGSDHFSNIVGPATAVSLLTLVYGMAVKVLCYVAEQKVVTLSGQQ